MVTLRVLKFFDGTVQGYVSILQGILKEEIAHHNEYMASLDDEECQGRYQRTIHEIHRIMQDIDALVVPNREFDDCRQDLVRVGTQMEDAFTMAAQGDSQWDIRIPAIQSTIRKVLQELTRLNRKYYPKAH